MSLTTRLAVFGFLAIAVLGMAAGRTFSEFGGYLRASAETTVEGLAGGLPREVRDKKMENDLTQVRAELVDRRVKLNQSARQIESLRTELKEQSERTDRDRRVLLEATPVLESAIKTKSKTVKFASAELTLTDFQREIDDLLARRDRDKRELAVKQDALARLEGRQRQAEQALEDSSRALEVAEREIVLLRSRRDHAEVEGRTIALVNAISESIKAPRASIGESLGRLRDEVARLESRNEAEQSVVPSAGRPGGETIAREFDRIQALRAISAESPKADQPTSKQPTSNVNRP